MGRVPGLRASAASVDCESCRAHGEAGARDIADRLVASLGSMLCYWYHYSFNGRRIDVETRDGSVGRHFLSLLHGAEAPPGWARAMHTSLNLYAGH